MPATNAKSTRDYATTLRNLLALAEKASTSDEAQAALAKAATFAANHGLDLVQAQAKTDAEHAFGTSYFTYEVTGASGAGVARARAYLSVAAAMGASGLYAGSTHDSTAKRPVILHIVTPRDTEDALRAIFTAMTPPLEHGGHDAVAGWRQNSNTSSNSSYEANRVQRSYIEGWGRGLAQAIHDARLSNSRSKERTALVLQLENAVGEELARRFPRTRKGGPARLDTTAWMQGQHDGKTFGRGVESSNTDSPAPLAIEDGSNTRAEASAVATA